MKYLVRFSVVASVVILAAGCATTAEQSASNDKLESRMQARDALVMKSEQRRIKALTVSSEMRQPTNANTGQSSRRP
jgi:hypothetical protein